MNNINQFTALSSYSRYKLSYLKFKYLACVIFIKQKIDTLPNFISKYFVDRGMDAMTLCTKILLYIVINPSISLYFNFITQCDHHAQCSINNTKFG